VISVTSWISVFIPLPVDVIAVLLTSSLPSILSLLLMMSFVGLLVMPLCVLHLITLL
jgi:hypothetical protein